MMRGATPEAWTRICELHDVVPDTGVCALLAGRQIAIFRCGSSVFALDNHDPASGVNVLSRGLVGDIKGEKVVASPIYKHHYSLTTGRCLEDPRMSVDVYPVRLLEGRIWVNGFTTGIELHAPASTAEAAGSAETLVLRDPRRGVYKQLTICDNRLRRAVLYGDARDGQWYFELMAAQSDIGPLRDQLLFGPPPLASAAVA